MPDARASLDARIRTIVTAGENQSLRFWWERAQGLVQDRSIYAYYVHQSSGYVDIAVLADHVVIGLEADESKPADNHLSVYQLTMCSQVRIASGPAIGIPRANQAKLVCSDPPAT